MKPKEYIDKYCIQKGWDSKHQTNFLQDLTNDLLVMLEYNKAIDNIKGFDNALRTIRQKWDSISNKIRFGLPEGMWRYFFATVVVKLRDEMCSREVQARKEIAEEKRMAWEARQEARRAWEQQWDDLFRESIYERLFISMLILSATPTESFAFMGLSTDATEDEIKTKFRDLAMKYHPDKGGDKDKFTALLEHKNKCLSWATRNKC
jgi:hypothetical protein